LQIEKSFLEIKTMKELLFNKKAKIITFIFISLLWLGFCFSLMLPQIIAFYIPIVESVIGKAITLERVMQNSAKVAQGGFLVYFFLIFLIILEKYFIKQDKKLNLELIFILIISLLAIAVRIAGFNHKSGDFIGHLSVWLSHLRENGHFLGLSNFPGNYNAIYIYILSLLSYLPQSMDLYSIKIISTISDILCAIFAMKIVVHLTNKEHIKLIAYSVILFSPTVFLNSGIWGQCDSILALFMLITFYYLLKKKYIISMLFFGLGLSFKPQAIFTLPFVLLFFIYYKVSLKNFIYIFVGFFSISIPAWILGWPLLKWFYNYYSGTTFPESFLANNAPTIFTWGYIPALIPVIFIFTLLFCIGFLIVRKPNLPSNNTVLLLFLFCNFVIPFFLPNMHERYFYVGEIAVLLYSIINPKRFWIALLVIMPALATYSGYLWGTNPFPLVQLSLVMLLAVIFITKWLIESIYHDQKA